VALRARTEAIARNLTEFLMKNDRFAKTIIFCVDQDHAEAMRYALNNLNADLAHQYPDYVVRVVSDEGKIGRGHLDRFMELETTVPTLVTTSQMLTTGVDVPTCKNIVLARVINSMTDFKQIIGRGTRVRDDYGKYFFSILDYTGSATRLFADPDFDGDPALITEEEMSETGERVGEPEVLAEEDVGAVREPPPDEVSPDLSADTSETLPRKFYVDNGSVEIAAHLVYELDADGKQLRVVRFTDYTAEKVRSMCPSAAALRSKWSSAEERAAILEALAERGISLEELMAASQQPDADPFDLLCNVAFNAPLRTRRERAEALRQEQKGFFDTYGPKAHEVLNDILEKYIDYGVAQFQIPEILKVPPISDRGTVMEIAAMFGGAEKLRTAVSEMQTLFYS
jgi:type I restriction enzyme R subunit